jgi:hypothetical protein
MINHLALRSVNQIVNMSFLAPIFDSNYRHPQAKEGDPDRSLSGWMRCGIFFGQGSLLVSFILLPFSLFFLINMFSVMYGDHSFAFKTNCQQAKAVIIEVEDAGMGNHGRIFKYTYQFFIGDENHVNSEFHKQTGLLVNSEVTVDYLISDHDISRIKAFHEEDGFFQVIFLIFPPLFLIYGVLGIINTFRFSIAEIILLKHGQIAQAIVNGSAVKGRDVYNIFVKYTTSDKELVNTTIESIYNKEKGESRTYPIIYLPFSPSKAAFIISFNSCKINLIYNNR